jgi:HAD superfamily hydrolase (TIGR01509 family)
MNSMLMTSIGVGVTCTTEPSLYVDAVIFDMDGLLVDSERVAMRGLAMAAHEVGRDLTDEFSRSLIGISADASLALTIDHFGAPFDSIGFLELAGAHTRELINQGQLKRKPGTSEFLDFLDEQRIPKGVATSSSREKARLHLEAAGLLRHFDHVITRDDVARGKPFPDLYLCAAERLNALPHRCLAFEDSYNGVRSAFAAGMRVIMVPDLLPPTDAMRTMTLMVLDDLHAACRIGLQRTSSNAAAVQDARHKTC